MSQQRRSFSAEQKADTVRRHLGDKVPFSGLAEELKAQPTQVHKWVKQAKPQIEQLFQRNAGGRLQANATDNKDQEIAKLMAKLLQKHKVISELMDENVKAKSQLGPMKGVWVPHNTCAKIVDHVKYCRERAKQPVRQLCFYWVAGQNFALGRIRISSLS